MTYPNTELYDDWREWAKDLVAELEARDRTATKPEVVGRLIVFRGTDVGAGYLRCDGSQFSDTSFPNLALLLGGTTLPNYVSPFPDSVVGIKT